MVRHEQMIQTKKQHRPTTEPEEVEIPVKAGYINVDRAQYDWLLDFIHNSKECSELGIKSPPDLIRVIIKELKLMKTRGFDVTDMLNAFHLLDIIGGLSFREVRDMIMTAYSSRNTNTTSSAIISKR